MDRGLQLDDGAEHAPLQASAGEGREERLDGVEPEAGGRRELEGPARMGASQARTLGCL
jgi:hypothetical protein